MFGYKKIGLALFISASLSGCDKDSDNTLAQLNKNRQIWENENISTYAMQYRRSCECLEEVTATRNVLVENDVVTSQVIQENNKALSTEEFEAQTISELFELIALSESSADNISVEYDATYGYPTQIGIDPNRQIADDEFLLTISALTRQDEIGCTAELVAGLSLIVLNETTGEPMNCDVVVTATDGAYTEMVNNNDTSCSDDTAINMIEERDGFYQLTIEKDYYETLVIDEFGIGRGLCHVFPRTLIVELVPE